MFSGEIYTAGTNFTRPPVVTVATNLNSGHEKVALFPLQSMFKIIVKVKVKNFTATFNISVFSVVSSLIIMR